MMSDDLDYHALGKSLAEGRGFSIDGKPFSYRTPGYPALIACCYMLFGESSLPVGVIQACLDILSALLLYLIGKRLFSESIGFWSAALLAFFPYQFLYVAHLMSETMFTALLLLSIWIAVQPAGVPSFRRLVLLGIVIGMATLVRPVVLLLPLVFIPFWRLSREPAGRSLGRIAVVAAGTLLVVAPWIWRNQQQFGRFTITSNTGVNLWTGHHLGAGGSYHYPATPDNPLHLVADDFERSDLGVRLSLQFMREHPLEEIPLTAKKIAHFFSADYWLMMMMQFTPKWKAYPNAATIYSDLSPAVTVLLQGPFILVAIFCWFAFVFHPNDSRRSILVLAGVFWYWFAAHLVFFTSARYRFPVNSIMMVSAVYGVHLVLSRTRLFNRRRLAAYALGLLVLVGGWSAEYFTLTLKRRPVPLVFRREVPEMPKQMISAISLPRPMKPWLLAALPPTAAVVQNLAMHGPMLSALPSYLIGPRPFPSREQGQGIRVQESGMQPSVTSRERPR